MSYFGRFYLDKEKDIVVTLELNKSNMSYTICTPNHHTGNLITNLASLIDMPITFDENGLKIIVGNVFSYIAGDNNTVYVMRLKNTKVANIYPDGRIERKAYIPAIAKTLMSQTKDYTLGIHKTLVKTYIRSEVKFHTDLHTHRSANLSPDILIALGIHHQICYPYYYVKKLDLKLTKKQNNEISVLRKQIALQYKNCGLTGKYLDRKIDDNTFLNFADLIMNNIENSSYNIANIRASLAVRKDGQAVFTDLEKVYLYRYVFTKPKLSAAKITYSNIEALDDKDIVETLNQISLDRLNPNYANNTLYQDKLLWTARSYAKAGIYYAEISDTALLKKTEAAQTLAQIHECMPNIINDTGVIIRFLASFRRIPLTIKKTEVDKSNYFVENLQVLKAIAKDPYVAGSDFVGEEINDIRELKPVIAKLVEIANEHPGFVIRVHAGENDSLPDNVYNSIACVEESLLPNQKFPTMRLGHGLYTAKLGSSKGKLLLEKLKKYNIVLEFQITSNVRLNNLTDMKNHPLKQYLANDIACVQGTDGGALYGSDPMDEELSLENMLELSFDELLKMKKIDDLIIENSRLNFEQKLVLFNNTCFNLNIREYYEDTIAHESDSFNVESTSNRSFDSQSELCALIKTLPNNKVPIILAGGSFNSATHKTKICKEETDFLDDLVARANPDKIYFVIGPSLTGYEKYLCDIAHDKFDIFAYIPSAITIEELNKFKRAGLNYRISIESSPMGIYKSIAFEVFKQRQNIILALDGNSTAANLIQDARNSKYLSYRFINNRSRVLRSKADSLQGYVTMWDGENANEVLKIANKFYKEL